MSCIFKLVEEAKKGDANNTLYGIEAVMDYNPEDRIVLEKIKARLLAINFEDDEADPPSSMWSNRRSSASRTRSKW